MENKYENMEINSYLEVNDVNRLILTELEQLSRVHTDETHYIAVYGKCYLIRELYETLICEGYHTSFAHFAFDDVVCKDDVYIMTIDENNEVSISDAYAPSGRVAGHDADVAIIYMDDCKQDIIDYCVNTDKKVILFDFECDECCDCGGCKGQCKMCNEQCLKIAVCPSDCDYKQCSGCPHIPSDSNTSISTHEISEYYINGKPVNKETFIQYQADFDKYFQSAMLEMSKFLKLLNW